MATTPRVPSQIARAISDHGDQIALADPLHTLTYAQLGQTIARLHPILPLDAPVAVFGKPSAMFGAAVTACVVLGRPFVHLDPAMPQEVLHNILSELQADTVIMAEPAQDGQLPATCTLVDMSDVMQTAGSAPSLPVQAADVADEDIIYIVATSGTTGKPKCIPVTHIAAHLSYAWRDAYTPYAPSDRMGAYIFAIWEMFRPLRNGASVHFATFAELMTPNDLVAFWQRARVTEMLFTPSALENALMALPPVPITGLALERIILNGEVVSDDLIAAVRARLPDVRLWNLYSICETHDVCMTDITKRDAQSGPVSVGVPMPHLRAVVLDDADQPCAPGQPGLLHFEGPQMLGPGYINRPEETALRFRNLSIGDRDTRLYDTGDQGYIDTDGAVFVLGRIAHMLKLRGHSIQTRELTDSLHEFLGFQQAVPWIKEVAGQGKVLVVYYASDTDQAAQNAREWQVGNGQVRLPAALSKAMRKTLPAYCVPSYLVRLDEIPINPVSGKYDYKRLPEIMPETVAQTSTTLGATILPTQSEAAKVMGCPAEALDPDLSFGEQGGDSLMAVTFLLALEKVYSGRVDFDFALNIPLARLHTLLSERREKDVRAEFTAKGVLLTGATGFLGQHVLAALACALPENQVIYCLIREKRAAPADRLARITSAQGVDPDRVVLITSQIEEAGFGLDPASYGALAGCVSRVVHCAAMVNLAVDRCQTQKWSHTGIANILQFCSGASADLCFTSSSAVFADVGGPHPEAASTYFDGCSGYGAAKIDAEGQIVEAGIPAAIVRLPSLYDLKRPNAKDIYEIILSACLRMRAVPEGLTFRMVDVKAAARFIAGLPPQVGARYYNLGPKALVCPAALPDDMEVLAQDEWIAKAPLSEGERALIVADPRVLRADCQFAHRNAQQAWHEITGTQIEATSAPQSLLNARFTNLSPRSP